MILIVLLNCFVPSVIFIASLRNWGRIARCANMRPLCNSLTSSCTSCTHYTKSTDYNNITVSCTLVVKHFLSARTMHHRVKKRKNVLPFAVTMPYSRLLCDFITDGEHYGEILGSTYQHILILQFAFAPIWISRLSAAETLRQ